MVQENFKNKQSRLKRGRGRSQKHNHRFSFMDPVIILISAAFSQPLGQWILKYALAEIDIKLLDYNRLLFSAMVLGVGLLMTTAWYIYSSKRR